MKWRKAVVVVKGDALLIDHVVGTVIVINSVRTLATGHSWLGVAYLAAGVVLARIMALSARK